MILRIAILTNIIPRYRTPIFNELENDPMFNIRYFLTQPLERSDSEAMKTLDLRYTQTINPRWSSRYTRSGVVNYENEPLPLPIGLPLDLLRFRPNIIVSGDLGVRTLIALIISRIIRVPLLIWSEETLEHDANVSKMQQRLRRFLIPRADGFLAWGKSAVNFLLVRGVSNRRIVYCAQAVDNEEWGCRAAKTDPQELRAELGTVGRICLVVGRLLPRKGLSQLLEAFSELPEHVRNSNTLIIAGDGPYRDTLQEQGRKLGINNIFFVGQKSPDDLAAYYEAADFLVMPSLMDVWGLVVNEAMACGLPALSSIWAGVTEELIVDTGIGEAFDPTNLKNFTSVLERWLVQPPVIKKGEIQEVVSRLNFNVSVTAIRKALLLYAGRATNAI